MRTIVIILSLLLALPTLANYIGGLSGTCEGNQTALTIGIVHIDFDSGHDEVGVRVYRSTLGTCDSEELLNPDQPLALPGEGETIEHVMQDPVLPGVGYQYWLKLVLADGTEIGLSGSAPVLEVVGCGDWAITRGTIEYDGNLELLEFQPCACWYPASILDVTGVDSATWLPYLNQVLEIRGEAWIDEMPGMADVIVTEIRPVGSCEAPVASRPTSWSAIKRLYD